DTGKDPCPPGDDRRAPAGQYTRDVEVEPTWLASAGGVQCCVPTCWRLQLRRPVLLPSPRVVRGSDNERQTAACTQLYRPTALESISLPRWCTLYRRPANFTRLLGL